MYYNHPCSQQMKECATLKGNDERGTMQTKVFDIKRVQSAREPCIISSKMSNLACRCLRCVPSIQVIVRASASEPCIISSKMSTLACRFLRCVPSIQVRVRASAREPCIISSKMSTLSISPVCSINTTKS